MSSQRMSVGLDVRARSMVAAAIDERTGGDRRRYRYDPADVVAWVGALQQPAVVTYEAGPTGSALGRLLRRGYQAPCRDAVEAAEERWGDPW